MRTRSQQQSPSNFVSLESTTRRTRSTRSASQPKPAPTTDRTNPDSTQEEPSGPSTQSATRAKGQRVTKKKAAPATKKKVTKSASKKAPAKGTRKSTRKTAKATSEEPESHEEETPETTPENDEDKENDAVQNTGAESATAEQALAEKDSAQSESTHPQDPQQSIPRAQDTSNQPHSPTTPSPVKTAGASWTDFLLDDISDIGSPLSERSRTPSLDEPLFADGELDEILFEQIRGTLRAHGAELEGRGAGQCVQSIEDSAWKQPEAPNAFESPAVTEPAAAESTESVAVKEHDEAINQQPEADSLSTFAVASGGETVADEQVDNLAQHFAKLSLADIVPRPAAVLTPGLPDGPTWQPEPVRPASDPTGVSLTVSSGSSDHASQAAVSVVLADSRGPSIFNMPPPSFELPSIGEIAQRQSQQTPSLFSLAHEPPRSSYDEPSLHWRLRVRDQQGVLEPEALAEGRHPRFCPAEVREPTERSPVPVRSSTPAVGSRPRVPAVLSPIPEQSESEMSPGLGGSKVGAGKEVAVEASVSSAVSQALVVSRETSRCLNASDRPVNKKLTPKKVNRKRARSVVSDDETAEGGPETPIANKRRNLGAPGSTPFARRLPPLSRRLSSTSVPYSERLRRRRVEREGRIHRTVFRLPEFIEQEKADRQAAETASQQSPCPEPPLAHDETPEEPMQDQSVEDAPSEPTQEPPSALPETPRRGWNIRGLLNSVPRSFSRFIPGLSRSSAQTNQNQQNKQSLPSSKSETTVQPASERINRTVDSEGEVAPARAKFRSWKPRRRQTEGPTSRPHVDWSLFPPPMDKSLYLGDISTPVKDLPEPSSLQSSYLQSVSSQPSSSQPSTAADPRLYNQMKPATATTTSESTTQVEDASSASHAQVSRGRETPQQSISKEKKRKREPSPDVIPNPPGCSYGMDLDYFYYSSESEGESDTETPEKSTAPQQAGGLARTAVRSALRSDRPASKKVRFDASPEDTPSKLRTRARATDPYTGSHFIGMGSGSPSSTVAPPSPSPRAPAPTVADEEEEDLYRPPPVVDPRTRPGFIPNTQGTFQLDYDAFSDDSSESSGPPSPPSVSAPTAAPAAETQLDERYVGPDKLGVSRIHASNILYLTVTNPLHHLLYHLLHLAQPQPLFRRPQQLW